jgi:hypothetical protein
LCRLRRLRRRTGHGIAFVATLGHNRCLALLPIKARQNVCGLCLLTLLIDLIGQVL